MIRIIITSSVLLWCIGNALATETISPDLFTDQLIVKKKEIVTTNRNAQIQSISNNNTTKIIKLPATMSQQDAQNYANTLSQSSNDIEYVEPDRRVYTNTIVTPNDTSYNKQWSYADPSKGLLGASNLTQAWAITKGSPNITVAIVDTGVTLHPDLSTPSNGIPLGRDFISKVAMSNDGNGRDNDPTDAGDWISTTDQASSEFAHCTLRNSSWHGTHIAGAIAAQTNNIEGVAGINWQANLLHLRVMGKCGGYTSDVADAIRWAAGETIDGVSNSRPAHIINLSFGGEGICGKTEQAAIDYAVSNGVIVVAAAGNNNIDASNQFPGNCNNVITVAALQQNGFKASFSNHGKTVDIAAPGTSILSTFMVGTQYPETPSYQYLSGTSMATAQVSGIIALMLASNSQLLDTKRVPLEKRAALIKQRLLQSSRPFATVPNSDCYVGYCGQGMLDAKKAVEAALKPPVEEIDIRIMQKVGISVSTIADSAGGTGNFSWLLLLGLGLLLPLRYICPKVRRLTNSTLDRWS